MITLPLLSYLIYRYIEFYFINLTSLNNFNQNTRKMILLHVPKKKKKKLIFIFRARAF